MEPLEKIPIRAEKRGSSRFGAHAGGVLSMLRVRQRPVLSVSLEPISLPLQRHTVSMMFVEDAGSTHLMSERRWWAREYFCSWLVTQIQLLVY
jgi:hypothetical protein